MGLLTHILAGMAGGRRGGFPMGRAGGLSPAVMVLLPIVMQMLAQRRAANAGAQRPVPMPQAGRPSGGGLSGGLGGLLERLTQRGYGPQVQSWISTGDNQPLPAHAVDDVFDEQELSQLAEQAGLSREEAREGLSQLLPEVVDDLTPEGQLPPEQQLRASVEAYASRLPGV